jgi:hypothetical protein
MSTPILAGTDWSLADVRAKVRAANPNVTPIFLDEMVPALLGAAVKYGVDPAVLIGQSAHETGWGVFGRATTPEHHNTCGLKVTRPVGPDDNPDDHARFATWAEGATAHAQHLYAYMGIPLPAGAVNIDPRWVWVYGKHAITTLEELGGKWAPSLTYGSTVAVVAARLHAAPYAPKPTPEPEPEPVPVGRTFTATFTATLREA